MTLDLTEVFQPEPDEAQCVACSKDIRAGELVFTGFYISPAGRAHRHYICNRCGNRAHRSRAFHRRIAARVELMFSKPAGCA